MGSFAFKRIKCKVGVEHDQCALVVLQDFVLFLQCCKWLPKALVKDDWVWQLLKKAGTTKCNKKHKSLWQDLLGLQWKHSTSVANEGTKKGTEKWAHQPIKIIWSLALSNALHYERYLKWPVPSNWKVWTAVPQSKRSSFCPSTATHNFHRITASQFSQGYSHLSLLKFKEYCLISMFWLQGQLKQSQLTTIRFRYCCSWFTQHKCRAATGLSSNIGLNYLSKNILFTQRFSSEISSLHVFTKSYIQVTFTQQVFWKSKG